MTDYYSLHERITCRPFLKLFEIFPFYPLSCLLNNLIFINPSHKVSIHQNVHPVPFLHRPLCPYSSPPSQSPHLYPLTLVNKIPTSPSLILFTHLSPLAPPPLIPQPNPSSYLHIYTSAASFPFFPNYLPFLFAGPSLNLRSTL